jgi:hypothetical protein
MDTSLTATANDLVQAWQWLIDATDLTHTSDAAAFTTIADLIESHPNFNEALDIMTVEEQRHAARRQR